MDISSLGTAPIPGDNPAGRDVRLEDDFFHIQGEIDRLNSLSLVEEGGIKWPRVTELACKILKDDSKDILVAVYLSVSLLETEGVESLGASSLMLDDLIQNFWGSLYPPLKRLRARVNALDWWRDRTGAWIKKYAGGEVDADVLDQAHDGLKKLDQTLLDKNLPRASDLLKHLALIPKKAKQAPPPPPAPEQPAPPAQPAGDTAAAAAAPAAPPPAAAPSQPAAAPAAQPAAGAAPAQAVNLAPEDEFQASSALIQAADNYVNFLGRNYADPRYWSLTRLRLWLPIKNVPPSENFKTRIAAPEKELIVNIQSLLSKGDDDEALKQIEGAVDSYLFFLDLHYLAYRALSGKGLAVPAQTLRWSCQAFAACIPEVVDLCFDDGTPFASAETKGWLADSGGVATHAAKGQVDYQSLYNGEPQAILNRLASPELTPRNGRDRVEKAILEALLWQRMERPRTAAGAAMELEGLIKKYGLAEFDPDLASRAAKTIYNVYRGLGSPYQAKARESLNLLARLNPSEVLGLPAPDDE